MTTITEDYVSFETAKLLKDKGFNEPLSTYYNEDTLIQESIITRDWNNDKFVVNCITAPTLQMAMKWLREKHNIHIVVHPYTDMEGQHWGFIFDKFTYGCWIELGIYITDSWNSYEEACEVGIKYCLENLI